MSERIQLSAGLPEAYRHLAAAARTAEKAAAAAGLDQRLIELVKLRTSQLNGCAYCVDLHSHDARELGETERRLYLLPAWRETDLYSEQERAALELTEAMAKLSQTQDVPDEVYRQATKVFTEEQYVAVAWAATTMNALNRLGVTSRKPLEAR
ncbi:carboxymuconolactone decarboxylase family protein [Amycolatopsis sp. K13G38]|uniref:Carboxymuconolactone decarboxylase family protein n=1 Tax=Amycolatopsis acididurans TaxID=2724524 RepID=A0ABX1JGK6_9PSEU|nr:carboxymuconolactone decarboxylase family protein [Amycolatopsis acididurans]NKQ57550.1 carboxymuconolactone decarboxylase family protein [Amycolatopsis acididurans]